MAKVSNLQHHPIFIFKYKEAVNLAKVGNVGYLALNHFVLTVNICVFLILTSS